ncbi:MAG TPA: hypothetical protein VMA77_09625 [Solirubrobacteraceae bacterium]|nr:hypothetical protein [Solirubrobacteraceae bacterium]
MRQRIQLRLEELQAELNAGNRRLQELDAEQTQLREVMLRISGAMQVLGELLDSDTRVDAAAQPGAAAESNGRLDVPSHEPVGAGVVGGPHHRDLS